MTPTFRLLLDKALKPDVCPRCLWALHPIDEEKQIHTNFNVPLFLREFMAAEKMNDTVKCGQCERRFHHACVGEEGVKACVCSKAVSGPACTVCGLTAGLVESWGGVSVHFLCAFFSRRFHLANTQRLEFVPLKASPCKVPERSCLMCEGTIVAGDSAFTCLCNKASHIFCGLYTLAQFDQLPEMAETYYENTIFPFFYLDKPKAVQVSIDLAPLVEARVLPRLPDSPFAFQDTFYDFEMLCKDDRTADHSPHCFCHVYVHGNVAQCEFCNAWFHTLCISEYNLTKADLDPKNLKKPDSDAPIPKGRSVKRGSADMFATNYGGKRGAKIDKFDNIFFACPNCQFAAYFFLTKPDAPLTHSPLAPFVLLWVAHALPKSEKNRAKVTVAPVRLDSIEINAQLEAIRLKMQQERLQLCVWEREMLEFLRASVAEESAAHPPDYFYLRFAALRDRFLADYAHGDQHRLEKAYRSILAKTFDFFDKNRNALTESLEKKLTNAYRKHSHPPLREIVVALSQFLNKHFIDPIKKFYAEIQPLLPECNISQLHYLELEPFALKLIAAKRVTTAVRRVLDANHDSYFTHNFQDSVIRKEGFFAGLLPIEDFAVAQEKFRDLVTSLFIPEEQVAVSEAFVREFFAKKAGYTDTLALEKRLQDYKSGSLNDRIATGARWVLSVEDLEKNHSPSRARLYPSATLDECLGRSIIGEVKIAEMMGALAAKTNSKEIRRAVKQICRHVIDSGLALRAGVIDTLLSHRYNFQLNLYIKKKSGPLMLGELETILAHVPPDQQEIAQAKIAEARQIQEKVLALQLTSDSAELSNELASKAEAANLTLPDLRDRICCFNFARELNNATLKVYALDCDEEFLVSKWEEMVRTTDPDSLKKIVTMSLPTPCPFPELEAMRACVRGRFLEKQMEKSMICMFIGSHAEEFLPLAQPSSRQRLETYANDYKELTSLLSTLGLVPPDFLGGDAEVFVQQLDRILLLASQFVIDEEAVEEGVRAVRNLKFNSALIQKVKEFSKLAEPALQGRAPIPDLSAYRDVFSLVSKKSKTNIQPGIERMAFEASRIYNALAAIELEIAKFRERGTMFVDDAKNLLLSLRKYALAYKDVISTIEAQVTAHEQACANASSIIAQLCALDASELASKVELVVSEKAKVDQVPLESRAANDAKLTFTILLRLAEIKSIDIKNFRQIVSEVRSTAQFPGTQLEKSLVAEMERYEQMEMAWSRLKVDQGPEFRKTVHGILGLLRQNFRVTIDGKTAAQMSAELEMAERIEEGALGLFLEGNCKDIRFPPATVDKLASVIGTVEALNMKIAQKENKIKKLSLFFFLRHMGALSAPQVSRHISILIAEVMDRRSDFEAQMGVLDGYLARLSKAMPGILADGRDLPLPTFEECGPFDDSTYKDYFTNRERQYYALRVSAFDTLCAIVRARLGVRKPPVIRQTSVYVHKKILELTDKVIPATRDFPAALFGLLALLAPQYQSIVHSITGACFEPTIAPLIKRAPEVLAADLGDLCDRFTAHIHQQLKSERSSIIEKMVTELDHNITDWKSPLSLFDLTQYPQPADIERLSNELASLFEPDAAKRAEGKVHQLAQSFASDPTCFKSTIANFITLLNRSPGERRDMARYHYDVRRFVGRALEVSKRDVLNHCVEIPRGMPEEDREPPSPPIKRKRVKETTLSKEGAEPRLWQISMKFKFEGKLFTILTSSEPRALPIPPDTHLEMSFRNNLDKLPDWVEPQMKSGELFAGWLDPAQVRQVQLPDSFRLDRFQIYQLNYGALVSFYFCPPELLTFLRYIPRPGAEGRGDALYAVLVHNSPKSDFAQQFSPVSAPEDPKASSGGSK